MRIILQKVSSATLTINPDSEIPESLDYNSLPLCERHIDRGLVLLVGIEDSDTDEDLIWTAKKIANMRIFEDENGKMNLSVLDVNGSIFSVSQFTLYASIRKGNRPSLTDAGKPDFAKEMWDKFNQILRTDYGLNVRTGIFGTHMNVELVNDGPVTIFVDSKTMR